MESIKLTDAQKDKLLEMCKVLFPEDNFWWEYDMYGRGLKQDFNDVLCVQHTLEEPKKGWDNRPIKHKFFNIHWFEFCMTYLAEKIAKHDRYDDLNLHVDTILACWVNNTEKFPRKHPVDYLYEKFKKIKNENT